jgi:SAM-dependent methyltransferase
MISPDVAPAEPPRDPDDGPDQGYEYRGMMARAWDLLRGDHATWPDRAFYRHILDRRGGAALDVGCGTGRLILDYLAEGLDVDGVDNSPEMLAICRAKAETLGVELGGRLYEQEMDQLALNRRYSTVFVPSGTFMLLTERARAIEAMRRFHDCLEPGGALVISFNAKLWPGRRTPPQMQWSPWFRLAEQPQDDGTVVRRWISAKYDHVDQVEHEQNRYELIRDGIVVETEMHYRSPCVRWYTLDQAIDLFERAGFDRPLATAGDGFDPAGASDTHFKVIAERRD